MWRSIEEKEYQLMGASICFPDWRKLVRYSAAGPEMATLHDDGGFKAIVVGIEAGGHIPSHPEQLGLFHVLEGTGSMIVDGERFPLSPGVTMLAPAGSARGFEAETRLAFIAVRAEGEPDSTP